MTTYVKIVKPGKSQLVEADRVEFYRQYGWQPEVVEITAVLKPPKKTVKPKPAVEEEVGTVITGEQL